MPTQTHSPSHPRGHRRPAAGVPADPRRSRPTRASRASPRSGLAELGRRQRGQGAQGPLLPRQLRHPRRRLRGRLPRVPDPSRARPDPRLARRHRRRRQPRPGARRLRRLRRAGLPRRRHRRHRPGQGRHRCSAGCASATSTSCRRSCRRSGSASASSPRPAASAQDAADRLVAAGVTSILNFAPVVLAVPRSIEVRKVDLAVELQILSYYEQRRAGRRASTPSRRCGTSRVRLAQRCGARHGERVGFRRVHRRHRCQPPHRCSLSAARATVRRARRDLPKAIAGLVVASQHPRGRRAQHVQPHRGVRRRRALPRRLRRHPRLLLRARRPRTPTSSTRTSTASTTRPPSPTCSRSPPGSTRRCSARPRSSARSARAWELAQAEGGAKSTLNLLFRHALETGKRARTETGISRSTTSVSHAAVEMATERLGTLAGRRVLVVGAGEMGEGVAVALLGAGASRHHRHQPHRRPAPSTSPRASAAPSCRSSSFGDALADADVLLTCTGAGTIVVDRDARRSRPARASTRRCSIVDIAVPRNVDAERRDAAPASRCSTSTTCATGRPRACRSAPREADSVRAIVGEEVERFVIETTARQAAPLVSLLHERAEAIRQAELERFAARLGVARPGAARRGRGGHQGHRRQAAAPAVGAPQGATPAHRRASATPPPCATCSTCRELAAPARACVRHRHARQRAGADAGRARRRRRSRRARRASRSSWCSSRRSATSARTCRCTRSAVRACSSRRCSAPCSTAAPTSPPTRPRTCPSTRGAGAHDRRVLRAAQRRPTRWSAAALDAAAARRDGGHRRRCVAARSSPRSAPTSQFVELRGNIQTRLGKVPDGGAIVMAVAALEVLGLTELHRRRSSIPDAFVPAIGQGCVAVECRGDDADVLALLAAVDRSRHPPRRRDRAGVPRHARLRAARCRSARTPTATSSTASSPTRSRAARCARRSRSATARRPRRRQRSRVELRDARSTMAELARSPAARSS